MMEDTNEKLLERLLDGSITSSELDDLVSWLDTPMGKKRLSEQMDVVLDHAETHDSSAAVDMRLAAVYNRIERHVKSARIRRYSLRVAAVILPFFVVSSLLYITHRQTQLFSPAEYAEIVTARGERVQVVFQDGTRAYLNADSRLRYPAKFGFWNRKVFLNGEAYFDVHSNKHRPFIVDITDAAIRVTGTSFDVKAYSDTPVATVTLDEGHVELVTDNDSYPLRPSEQLSFDRDHKMITITKLPSTERESLWKNNVIAFDKAPLDEVLRTLGRWYDVEFVVTSPRAYDYLYTYTSEFVPLDSLLTDLELLAPIKFRHNGDKIEIFVK